jgi:hypothetical protein
VKRALLVGGAVLAAVGCGIGIGRDLREMPTQQVVFDDACKVQEYHDDVALGLVHAPAIVNSKEVEHATGAQPAGGVTTFAFEEEPQLRVLRRVLNENWEKLPEKLMKAQRVELQVKWAEKAGVRRVVTTEDAQISYETTTSYLPYHVCLSELLFGAPLYRTRRELLGLPPLPTLDAGAHDATISGGQARDAATPDAAASH